ncbi:hypothetical protein [Alicyclobacillus shizuokensis]|uniref:hypothetical protein n=1 Tax=Alicyclobacillus shizuokensis TaxID=392014 RepID=UPI0008324537|nr:hypothetical protein [Alicyclobacillus shizuokensis]
MTVAYTGKYIGNPNASYETDVTPKNAAGRLSRIWKNTSFPLFTGLGTAVGMASGESLPVALGKSVMENALWSLVPGGFATMLGVTAAQMLPEIMNATTMAESRLGQRSAMFGAGYIDTEAAASLRQTTLNQMMQARQNASLAVMGHARNAAKAY